MPDRPPPFSTAAIIAVGSELLTPFRSDTNSLAITSRLNDVGVTVVLKQIVGDVQADLALAFRQALDRADLVVLTGGLGPTSDDVTRPVVADVLGLPLETDVRLLERIRGRFAARGLEMPAVNRVQAEVPRGAVILPNANGTAPGLWIEIGHRAAVLLPGPPREMAPMLDAVVQERIAPRGSGDRVYRRVLRVAGLTESQVESAAQPVYARFASGDVPVSTSILAAPGQVELHLSATCSDERAANSALDRAGRDLAAVLGVHLFSSDGRPLEAVVGGLLAARRWRIALAESCTGGLTLSRLTDVPGSSGWVDRGVVCYSNRAKVELAGVAVDLIERHGAVSEPVARAMADGIRVRSGVEVGVGITGIAGPGGGSEEKPVGTVAIAVACPHGATVRTFRFLGRREQVKWQSAQAALDMVRRVLGEP